MRAPVSMRRRLWTKPATAIFLALMFGATFFGGWASAHTLTVAGYYANGLEGEFPLPDRCFHITVELRHPALSGFHTIDYNTYNRSRSGSSCNVLYSRPPDYLAVRGAFIWNGVGNNDGKVCASFDWVDNDDYTATFAVGAGYFDPNGACAGGQGGGFYARGNAYRLINGDITASGFYGTSNHGF